MNRRSKALTVVDQAITERLASPPSVPPAERTAEWYAARSHAENTYRAYRSSIKDFVQWMGVPFPFPCSPEHVAEYISQQAARYKLATIRQRINAISFVHRMLEMDDPTRSVWVRNVLRGIAKTLAEGEPATLSPVAPDDAEHASRGRIQAPTFTADEFRRMIDATWAHEGLAVQRDRAYLLLGVYGAFRQSEMTSLRVDQLIWQDDELVIRMGAVKQDQTGEQRLVKAIPRVQDERYCPVTALKAWMAAADIEDGAVFRAVNRHGHVSPRPLSHTATNNLIKKWVRQAGIEQAELFSGHSLRASFVTILRELGLTDAQIARQTNHLHLQSMQVYDRPRDALRHTPARVLGDVVCASEGD